MTNLEIIKNIKGIAKRMPKQFRLTFEDGSHLTPTLSNPFYMTKWTRVTLSTRSETILNISIFHDDDCEDMNNIAKSTLEIIISFYRGFTNIHYGL